MRAALAIAGNDLRRRTRDRSALVLGFIAPVVIAGLVSVAFQSADAFHTTVAVADLDGGPVGDALRTGLRTAPLDEILSLKEFRTRADAVDAVRDGDAEGGLVIPAGFTEAAGSFAPTPIEVLTSVDKPVTAAVVHAIAEAFVGRVDAVRLAVATAIAAGADTSELAALGAEAAQLPLPEDVVDRPSGGHELRTIDYYAPAMAIFFLLFTVGFGARTFANERRDGMLMRVAAAPVSARTILAGKALANLAYGIGVMTSMGVVTIVGFGAEFGPVAAAAALSAAMVLAVVGLTVLTITVARTDRQVDGVASALVFVLALLGGNFIFIGNAPPLLRKLALVTPNGWALRGFTDLTTTGDAGTALVPGLAIVAFAIVVMSIAAVRADSAIRR